MPKLSKMNEIFKTTSISALPRVGLWTLWPLGFVVYAGF